MHITTWGRVVPQHTSYFWHVDLLNNPTPIINKTISSTIGQIATMEPGKSIFQICTNPQNDTWRLATYTEHDNKVDITDHIGAHTIKAGGGHYAAGRPDTGVRTSFRPHQQNTFGLYDMNEHGWVLISPVYQEGRQIALIKPTAPTLQLIWPSTGYIDGPSPRLKNEYLSFRDERGWHIFNNVDPTLPEFTYLRRKEDVNLLIPVYHRGELWVIERTERLTLRRPSSQMGFILYNDTGTFNVDGVSLQTIDTITSVWSVTEGEPSEAFRTNSILSPHLNISAQVNLDETIPGPIHLPSSSPSSSPSEAPLEVTIDHWGPSEGVAPHTMTAAASSNKPATITWFLNGIDCGSGPNFVAHLGPGTFDLVARASTGVEVVSTGKLRRIIVRQPSVIPPAASSPSTSVSTSPSTSPSASPSFEPTIPVKISLWTRIRLWLIRLLS